MTSQPKEMQKILTKNPAGFERYERKSLASRGHTVHLMFQSNDPEDAITLPLCGESSIGKIVSHSKDHVSCSKCLDNLKALQRVQTLGEAKLLLKDLTVAPPSGVKEKHNMILADGTADPVSHIEYILGSAPELFWWNMQHYLKFGGE